MCAAAHAARLAMEALMQRGNPGARQGRRTGHRAGGFTLVWALAAVAILSVGLAVAGSTWSERSKRQREQELLRVGMLYAQAIEAYRAAAPGSLQTYPSSLEQLLLDTRFAGTVRHLRKLYPDPLDPARPWGVVRTPEGTIRGVFSQSAEAPLRVAPIDLGAVKLPSAGRYDHWQFVVGPDA